MVSEQNKEHFQRVGAMLNEAEDCIRQALAGNGSPIRKLIAMLAFELGTMLGELENRENESNSGRSSSKDSNRTST